MKTSIRAFMHGDHRYRHVIDTDSDDIELQRYNPKANKASEEWVPLLTYTADCIVRDTTGKHLGHFRSVSQPVGGEKWTYFEEGSEPITLRPLHESEGLLESEVVISKRWLDLATAN